MKTSAALLLRRSALTLVIACVFFPVSAFEIEEIVVTAQKREQSLQDVPISVNAFSKDFMARAGVNDVRGLVTLTPGFNGATEDSFTDAMTMRGISTNDYGVGGDPSTPVFVDGIWVGRTGGIQSSDLDNFDIVSQDSWEEVNLRVGFDSPDNWRLTLWVENVFDEEYFERGWATANEDNTGGFGTPNLQTWTSKPSTIGIDFEMEF